MKHSGYIVLTDDVNTLMLAITSATRTTLSECSETFIFANDTVVPHSIPDLNGCIKLWMSELFNHNKVSEKNVVFAPELCRKVSPHKMFEFIGWLPQLKTNLICVCDPSRMAGLPEWAFQLSTISEADYMLSIKRYSQPIVHGHCDSTPMGRDDLVVHNHETPYDSMGQRVACVISDDHQPGTLVGINVQAKGNDVNGKNHQHDMALVDLNEAPLLTDGLELDDTSGC